MRPLVTVAAPLALERWQGGKVEIAILMVVIPLFFGIMSKIGERFD